METEQIVEALNAGNEAAEDIADSLERVADAAEALLSSGLTEGALVLLIKSKAGGMAARDVRAVLRAIPQLRDFVYRPSNPDGEVR